jgi:hypothetical protein
MQKRDHTIKNAEFECIINGFVSGRIPHIINMTDIAHMLLDCTDL